jgi:hypothetical protein
MKSFTQKAIYSAIAGSSLMLAAGANAVNINTDGLGEVLLYPYYTVRGGAATLMTVVNTTSTAKAVKVRINEGKNSAEVLDFNLWLSANDVWTAAIVASGDGAGITTTDKSCTNPKITQTVAFRNAAYLTDNAALRTIDRTREGYIEIIEMAAVRPGSKTEADVTHDAGVPACTLVDAASVLTRLADYDNPTGGLFGGGTLVGSGQATGYNATAIEGFGYTAGVSSPRTVFPNLNSGTNTTAVVVDSLVAGTSRITAANFSISIDAVSAVMMHSSVLGEYGFDSTFSTDWVVTMPTKRFYVNSPTPRAPFQRIWNGATATGNGTACVDIGIASYDREEGTGRIADDFSPATEAGVPQLCWEATVVGFGPAAATAPSGVTGSVNVAHYDAFQAAGKSGGWAELTFGNNPGSSPPYSPLLAALPSSQQTLVSSTGIGAPVVGAVTFGGLPAIGFAIISATFPSAATQNFNSSFNLNFRRSIR